MNNLKEWEKITDELDFAFQPIVDINSGDCYAFEVLLRNCEKNGFFSIQDFFDRAYKEKVLYRVDLILREKAFKKFMRLKNYSDYKIFYNIDNRLLEMPDYSTGNTLKILDKLSISGENICFEISERHEFSHFYEMKAILNIYREQGFYIALDDFGTGFSGLQVLYHTEPNMIKIDRFFIENISKDIKKKLFTSNIVNLCHTIGIKVTAEGVEKEEEYIICKELGVDFIQGYFVEKPLIEIEKLKMSYEHIRELNERYSKRESDRSILYDYIEKLESVSIGDSIAEVFERFRKDKEAGIIPVIDERKEPLGVIEEKELKKYIYSPFGKEILINKTQGHDLNIFIKECPIASINNDLRKIMEIVALNNDLQGIIITENSKYYGFLGINSILKIVSEKKLSEAREQNPLTKLPGNTKISEYINSIIKLEERDKKFIIAYFDIDNFKAFNDKYGFRNGDRIINMFADILRKKLSEMDVFIGHIGGDDFFAGITVYNEVTANKCYEKLLKIRNKFLEESKNFYDKEDLKKEYILVKDRYGEKRKIPLLDVSIAAILITDKANLKNMEKGVEYFSVLKEQAKKTNEKVVFTSLL